MAVGSWYVAVRLILFDVWKLRKNELTAFNLNIIDRTGIAMFWLHIDCHHCDYYISM